MPELPEVETTIRGIRPCLQDQTINKVVIRKRQLRFPITAGLNKKIRNLRVVNIQRRGKYILINLDRGGLILHLGMSGSLRILKHPKPPGKHEHYDLITAHGILRYNDPRRFGCFLYSTQDLNKHRLIKNLGAEPLGNNFTAEYLYNRSRGRKVAVKNFLMNANVVVGVGNIYAAEALFAARINPHRAAGKISLSRYEKLTNAVRKILSNAIKSGGTTIRDFASADGSPGYFAQSLSVYGRGGETCTNCKGRIANVVISQRSTFYCPRCQK